MGQFLTHEYICTYKFSRAIYEANLDFYERN